MIQMENDCMYGAFQGLQEVPENFQIYNIYLFIFYFFILFYSSLKSLKKRDRKRINILKYKMFFTLRVPVWLMQEKCLQSVDFKNVFLNSGTFRDMQGCGDAA